jgi:hypothetical protein
MSVVMLNVVAPSSGSITAVGSAVQGRLIERERLGTIHVLK